jgi:G3E family GTPase
MTLKARYIMIGGFLGAGKTTSIIAIAKKLKEKNIKAGLISNDQANNLVDTQLMRNNGFDVAEISGGCFCCRFDSLKDAALKLNKDHSPDVFLAEPVGSCTDLIATVSYPLRRMYGDEFCIAPLSVLVDPKRCSAMLGLNNQKKFSEKVQYIYIKQLEEADAIVINKVDKYDDKFIALLQNEISKRYPKKKIFRVSSKDGNGLDHWYEWLLANEFQNPTTMEVDYKKYAEGESLLGWLNATLSIKSNSNLDGNTFLKNYCNSFKTQLNNDIANIAHLKMTLIPQEAMGEIASIHLVDNTSIPELGHSLEDPFKNATLTINVRAETDPSILLNSLEFVTSQIQKENGLALTLLHSEHFKPSPPVPTWRDNNNE